MALHFVASSPAHPCASLVIRVLAAITPYIKQRNKSLTAKSTRKLEIGRKLGFIDGECGMNRSAVYVLFLAMMILIRLGSAADWTYDTEVEHPSPTKDKYRYAHAYIWIPSSCTDHVRGLVLASQTSSEETFAVDPSIREAALQAKLAIIFIRGGGLSVPEIPADTVLLNNILAKLALETGFPEIEHAPWFTVGHSTSSNFTVGLAYWKPERTFGFMTYKGGITGPLDWMEQTQEELYDSLQYIPILGVQGNYEEFGGHRDSAVGTEQAIRDSRAQVMRLRRRDPSRFLISSFMCIGEGHMGWSKQAAPLLGMFIRKAAERRIPENAFAVNGPVELNTMSAENGWLADTGIVENPAELEIDSAGTSSDPQDHFWMSDREFADAWVAWHRTAARAQQIVAPEWAKPRIEPSVMNYTYDDNSKTYGAINLSVYDCYTITAGASSGLPTHIYVQSGPGIAKNDSVLCFHPCRVFDTRTVRVMIRQNGNEQYKPADRMIKFKINPTASGTQQSLEWEPLPQLVNAGDTVTLEATATAAGPVTFEIVSGPAELIDSTRMVVTTSVVNKETTPIHIRAGHLGSDDFHAVVKDLWLDASVTPVHTRRPSVAGHVRASTLSIAGNRLRVAPVSYERTARVLNASGRLVGTITVAAHARTASLPRLQPGIYLVELSNEVVRIPVR